METYKNKFTNGEITVSFEPRKCINAGICAKDLGEVFRTSVIPWIDLDAASALNIINQVKKCPSGALSCSYTKKLTGTY